jgi:hypothetical protein
MNVAAKLKIKQKVQLKKNIVEYLLSLQEGLKILSVYFNELYKMGYFDFLASGEHNINIASDLTYEEKEKLIGVSSDAPLK